MTYILFGLIWYATTEPPESPSITFWSPFDPVDDWCSAEGQNEFTC